MKTKENRTENKMEIVKTILKKSAMIYNILFVVGMFLAGCYTALIVENGTDNYLLFGLIASIIFSILSFTCKKLIEKI